MGASPVGGLEYKKPPPDVIVLLACAGMRHGAGDAGLRFARWSHTVLLEGILGPEIRRPGRPGRPGVRAGLALALAGERVKRLHFSWVVINQLEGFST